jgi:hypothetical protein
MDSPTLEDKGRGMKYFMDVSHAKHFYNHFNSKAEAGKSFVL